MSKMAYKIICKLCSKDYISSNKHTKVCKDCRGKWCAMNRKYKAEYVSKKCLVCGKEFIIYGAIGANKKCCSHKCGRIESWRNGSRPKGKTITKECKNCGKNFDRFVSAERVTVVTHCSRKCYYESRKYKVALICASSIRNRGSDGQLVKIDCVKCGKEFLRLKSRLKAKNYCSRECSKDCRKLDGALWRDKDYIKSYYRNYSHINREKLLEGQRVRKQQKANTENRLKPKEWKEILEKYNHSCLKCGTKEKITIDHIIPLSKKGTHTKDNVQPLCKSCNSSKRVQIIDYRLKEVYDKDF